MKQINPKKDRREIDQMDISLPENFPKFLKKIEFEGFKQFNELIVNFKHPISVISGVNRVGKTTVLMAIACSHLNFQKRNIRNGNLERHTWSSLMKFTEQDIQSNDWTYYITYKVGKKEEKKRGQRKKDTKKWNGIGKKESQFDYNKQVRFLDLSRLLPARNFGEAVFSKIIGVSNETVSLRVKEYLSYILEEDFWITHQLSYQDKDIFNYNDKYSSYNAASGEEVLTKILIEIVDAPRDSLILIDELDVGLHPKIQRRLMEVIYNISVNDKKQFIITSHSQTILSCVPASARIFIENKNENFICIQDISVNVALSKMDSIIYPLFDVYCEDEIAKKIIEKLLVSCGCFDVKAINIIDCGDYNKTYEFYRNYEETYDKRKIKSGYVCILDADAKKKYPGVSDIHFLFGSLTGKSPEYFLVEQYLKKHPNKNLEYHLRKTNSHVLFGKMVEFGLSINKEDAFNLCWDSFFQSSDFISYLEEFREFICNKIMYFTEKNL